uniref:Uncharacterized protein n=1 Tax=Anopheles minimus TaxID=112268 RepID=A0A182WP75_9DIPT
MTKPLLLTCAVLVGVLLVCNSPPVQSHLQNCININSTTVYCTVSNSTGYSHGHRHRAISTIVKALSSSLTNNQPQ